MWLLFMPNQIPYVDLEPLQPDPSVRRMRTKLEESHYKIKNRKKKMLHRFHNRSFTFNVRIVPSRETQHRHILFGYTNAHYAVKPSPLAAGTGGPCCESQIPM